MQKTGPQEKQRRHGPSPEEAALLDLLRTTDMLSRGLLQVLKNEDLSGTQYNVLRILRGAPEGLPCGEIANRMITRDPDVTRLLDRLEKRGLISRCRETKDRRTVMTRITPAGLKLLARIWMNRCRPRTGSNWAIWDRSGCERWRNCCRSRAAG